MVFAAAPSQNEFLAHLTKNRNIDWSRVTCFHLDDYVDLPRYHPNTFETYLKEHLFDHVNPRRIYFLKALKGSPARVARQYGEYIRRNGGVDIACIGIGENGHIAFCEPGADLNDPQMVRIIRINDRSVRQQYRDYKDDPNPKARYASLKAVPRRAFTMTVPAILSAREIYTMVPGPQKADAVRKMWEGPISSACPSSALRMHSSGQDIPEIGIRPEVGWRLKCSFIDCVIFFGDPEISDRPIGRRFGRNGRLREK